MCSLQQPEIFANCRRRLWTFVLDLDSSRPPGTRPIAFLGLDTDERVRKGNGRQRRINAIMMSQKWFFVWFSHYRLTSLEFWGTPPKRIS
jgi:hypothetical protein